MLKTKVVYHQQRPLLVSKNSPDPMDGNNKKEHQRSSSRSRATTGAAVFNPIGQTTRNQNYQQQQQSENDMAYRRGAGGVGNNPKLTSAEKGKVVTDNKHRKQGQQGGTSKPNTRKKSLDKELAVMKSPVDNRLKNATKKKKSSPSPAKTEAAPENDNLKTPPKKVDLKTYYKNQGTSLSQVRRMNRNYIRHDGPSSEADGVVFWDSYSPPPGYTEADVPLNDSQSQPKEEVVSPAILNAERYKLKPRPIFKTTHQTDAEFQALLNKITKRKAPDKENENASENPKKKSTPPEAPINTSVEEPLLNATFPDMMDDLNDSELMMFTQAAELENQYVEGVVTKVSEVIDKNIANVNQQRKPGPINTSTPLEMPQGAGNFKNIGSETPKSVLSRGRTSRFRVGNTCSSPLLFENSDPPSSKHTRNSSRDNVRVTNIPRKALFSESRSPIKISGDFADDDDDMLFSQMDLPAGENNNSKTDVKLDGKEVADQSTEIINQSDSLFMRSDFLNEIDILEEMAICSQVVRDKRVDGLSNTVISLVHDVKRQQENVAGTSSKAANSETPGKPRLLKGLGRNNGNRK